MRVLSIAVSLLLVIPSIAIAADLPKGVFDRVGGSTFQHPDRPVAFDFSPNGKHLASGGTDGSVRIWDVRKQILLHTLSVKGEEVGQFRYSADGRFLFAHFSDAKVRRYEADVNYKPLGTTAAKHLDAFSVSTDGSAIAGREITASLKVFDAVTGLERLEIPSASTACLLPDGSAVVVVSADNVLTVHAIPGGKPLQTIKPPKGEEKVALTCMAVSADSRRVAVAPEWVAGTVRVYEFGKDEPLAEFAGEGPLRFVGKGLVAAKNRGRVILYDLAAKAVRGEFGDRVGAFAVSADGSMVATDNGGGVGATRIRLWDTASGNEIRGEVDEWAGLLGTAGRGDGTGWLCTSDRLFAWKPGTKPTGAMKFPFPVTALTATADRVFVASADGIRTIDAKKPTAAVLLQDSPKELVVLSASEDGSLLAGVDSVHRLVLTDGAGKGRRMWKLPTAAVGLAVQPNGKTVALIGRDGFVRVWDSSVDPAKPVERWKVKLARCPNAAITFTPDGKTVVVASMLKVVLFDLESGKQLATIDRSWDDGPFVSVAVSPDGCLVAAGTLGTNGVAVWERNTGAVVKRLTGSTAAFWHLSFADARTLLADAADGSTMAWDLSDRRGKSAPTSDELKAAWNSLGRGPEAVWQAGWVFTDAADPWVTFTDGIKAGREVFDGIDRNAALLGDPDFATREKATKALLAAGVAALPAVKLVAEKSEVAEARRRADDLMDKLTAIAEDPKRASSVDELTRLKVAVRVAERLGGPKAMTTLDELARFGGEVAKEAEAAKGRVKK